MSVDEKITKLPEFDWDKAKTFYYIVKLGNQIEAAKFLNVSQPTLSRQITILESELNCKLMIRRRTGTELTRKGREFFSIIERAFLDLKGFTFNNAAMVDDGEKRNIRISATQPIAAYVLGEHLLAYNELHPEILFEIVAENQKIDVVLNDVDIAIKSFDPGAKGVNQEYLFTIEKKMFASEGYLEKHGTPSTVEDLRHHKVISHSQPEKYPYSDLGWVLKYGMPEGEMRESIFMSNSLENAIAAAQRGMGIMASYKEMSIVRDSGLRTILPNIEGPKIKEYIMYPSYLEGDETISSLISYLCEKLNN